MADHAEEARMIEKEKEAYDHVRRFKLLIKYGIEIEEDEEEEENKSRDFWRRVSQRVKRMIEEECGDEDEEMEGRIEDVEWAITHFQLDIKRIIDEEKVEEAKRRNEKDDEIDYSVHRFLKNRKRIITREEDEILARIAEEAEKEFRALSIRLEPTVSDYIGRYLPIPRPRKRRLTLEEVVEELAEYQRRVSETQGFDVPRLRGVILRDRIVALDMDERDVEILTPLCKQALQEYNGQNNAGFKLDRVVKANVQSADGIMYYITFEALSGDMSRTFRAKVWEKPFDEESEMSDEESEIIEIKLCQMVESMKLQVDITT